MTRGASNPGPALPSPPQAIELDPAWAHHSRQACSGITAWLKTPLSHIGETPEEKLRAAKFTLDVCVNFSHEIFEDVLGSLGFSSGPAASVDDEVLPAPPNSVDQRRTVETPEASEGPPGHEDVALDPGKDQAGCESSLLRSGQWPTLHPMILIADDVCSSHRYRDPPRTLEPSSAQETTCFPGLLHSRCSPLPFGFDPSSRGWRSAVPPVSATAPPHPCHPDRGGQGLRGPSFVADGARRSSGDRCPLHRAPPFGVRVPGPREPDTNARHV